MATSPLLAGIGGRYFDNCNQAAPVAERPKEISQLAGVVAPYSLDPSNAERVLQLFFNLQKSHKASVVMVTHDPEIAAVTPRRIEIRDGKIAGKVDLTLAGMAHEAVLAGQPTAPQA